VSAVVDGLIEPGDLVAIKGDFGFFEALKAALGDRAASFVNADLDTRPDLYVGGDGAGGLTVSHPKQPGRASVAVDEDAPPDDRVFLIYVGETARQRDHLCGLAPVVLDATSPTFARVLKAERGGATSGLGLQLLDGQPVVTRLDA
jgi:hypothetical protein